MEGKWRWVLVTAIAPVAWGSTYYVTSHFLPADAPLWGAAFRALPAAVLLLAIARRLPRGAWWWKSAVIGVLNVGAFFVLVYLSGVLLPSSVASTVMALSPLVMLLLAWALIAERPGLIALVASGLGIAGVVAIVAGPVERVDPGGVACAVAAMLMSSLGFVLAKRWRSADDLVASTGWQLAWGGLAVLVVAALVEGPPPALDMASALGFLYLTLVATAIAYLAWLGGIGRLGVGAVGLIGLLNPVTGVALGVALAGESITWVQAGGIGLVVVAIVLGQLPGRRSETEPPWRDSNSRPSG